MFQPQTRKTVQDWIEGLIGFPRLPGTPRFAVHFAEPDEGDGGGSGGDGTGGDGGEGGGGDAGDEFANDPRTKALVAEKVKYHKRAQSVEQQLAALEAKALTDEQLAEFQTLKTQQTEAEETRLKESGDFDKLREAMEAKHADAIGGKDATIEKLTGSLRTILVEQSLTQALAAAKVMPDYLGMAVELLSKRVRVSLDGDTPKVSVLDADGSAAVDPDSDDGHMSVEGLVSIQGR